jgi:hypothetical protein
LTVHTTSFESASGHSSEGRGNGVVPRATAGNACGLVVARWIQPFQPRWAGTGESTTSTRIHGLRSAIDAFGAFSDRCCS